eukprot:2085195-Lingulodinium_polyedra.AAC.1
MSSLSQKQHIGRPERAHPAPRWEPHRCTTSARTRQRRPRNRRRPPCRQLKTCSSGGCGRRWAKGRDGAAWAPGATSSSHSTG